MEEDIQNYSPIVMFRGTPCKFNLDVNLHLKCAIMDLQQYIQYISSSLT